MNEAAVSLGVPGWFGKMPSLGDFASRRLPDEFIRGWDGWLQHGLAVARETLGDQWLDENVDAPARRFWLGPGVLGSACWTGAMMPSVDRVGRHFPLTIAVGLGGESHSLAAALASHLWFCAVEDAGRRVFDVAFTIDDLESRLTDVASSVPDVMDEGSSVETLAVSLLRPFAVTTRTPRSRRWTRSFTGGADDNAPVIKPCSVWWCGDAHEESQFLVVEALPPAESLAALLSVRSAL